MGLQIRQKLSSLGPLFAFDAPSPTGSLSPESLQLNAPPPTFRGMPSTMLTCEQPVELGKDRPPQMRLIASPRSLACLLVATLAACGSTPPS
ncbi:hypothetical protein, partial [Acidovorax sp. BoFeN1]|uniref:hypothetical protein n=1 Tax=Acidovorax sp. BoFeN1 TaxID=1231053 RepID=UPI001F227F2C